MKITTKLLGTGRCDAGSLVLLTGVVFLKLKPRGMSFSTCCADNLSSSYRQLHGAFLSPILINPTFHYLSFCLSERYFVNKMKVHSLFFHCIIPSQNISSTSICNGMTRKQMLSVLPWGKRTGIFPVCMTLPMARTFPKRDYHQAFFHFSYFSNFISCKLHHPQPISWALGK